jgi:hypothetical protein
MSQSLTTRLRWVACIGAVACFTGAASAQTLQYDANCNRKDYNDDEKLVQEVCSGHFGCRLVMLAEKACVVKDFFGNLGRSLTGRSQPDNLDVAWALSQSEIVQTPGVRSHTSKARSVASQSRLPSYDRTNAAQISFDESKPADGASPRGYLNRNEGGFISWFEGKATGHGTKDFSGNGTHISSSGLVLSGNIVKGQLDGDGLWRRTSGGWQGGNFKNSQLNGEGFETAKAETGKAPVMEGTFLNGVADGMMLVTYPDFSSRKELWRGGKLVATGPTVAKGSVPPNPKTPEEDAAARAALAPQTPPAQTTASRPAATPSQPQASPAAAPGDADSCDSSAYFSENMANEDRYLAKSTPAGAYGGSREIYRNMYLKNRNSLAILDKHKACNSPAVYAEQRKYIEDTMKAALDGCMALSSDGGRGCTQE